MDKKNACGGIQEDAGSRSASVSAGQASLALSALLADRGRQTRPVGVSLATLLLGIFPNAEIRRIGISCAPPLSGYFGKTQKIKRNWRGK